MKTIKELQELKTFKEQEISQFLTEKCRELLKEIKSVPRIYIDIEPIKTYSEGIVDVIVRTELEIKL